MEIIMNKGENKMNKRELILNIATLKMEIENKKTLLEKYENSLKTIKENEQKEIELRIAKFDVEKIRIAKEVLNIELPKEKSEITTECKLKIKCAILDICNKCNKMETHYFGVKSYSGWNSQGEDHKYNCGPRHGHIWFSIGLQREYRRIELTEKQLDAMIYYLENLLEIEYLGE